jgi:1,4-dihydroxy-2-naphthoyl-CoA hydrolase
MQEVNMAQADGMTRLLSIRFVSVGPDFIIGEMPVDERTRQPYGVLHGGASMVLAESLGSHASALLMADEPSSRVAGVEISGSHLRSVRSGMVTGICRVTKLGSRLHFWRIEIHDEKGRLCCAARLTVMVGIDSAGAAGD